MKIFLIAVLVLMIGAVLCGCVINFPSNFAYVFEKGSIGNAVIAEPIKAIEVEWATGNVHFVYADTQEITIEETANHAFTRKNQMRYDLNNGTLRIRFSSGKFRMFDLRKNLTVTLPRETILEYLHISSASADVLLEDLCIRETEIESASGAVQMALNGVKAVKVETVSGDVDFHCDGEVRAVEMSSVSGELCAMLGTVENWKADTVSGEICVAADNIRESEFSTTSGNVQVDLHSAPKECEIDSISGTVRLALPKDIGFTASIASISGSIRSGFATTNNGKIYVCGDGTSEIDISTVSGDITLEGK